MSRNAHASILDNKKLLEAVSLCPRNPKKINGKVTQLTPTTFMVGEKLPGTLTCPHEPDKNMITEKNAVLKVPRGCTYSNSEFEAHPPEVGILQDDVVIANAIVPSFNALGNAISNEEEIRLFLETLKRGGLADPKEGEGDIGKTKDLLGIDDQLRRGIEDMHTSDLFWNVGKIILGATVSVILLGAILIAVHATPPVGRNYAGVDLRKNQLNQMHQMSQRVTTTRNFPQQEAISRRNQMTHPTSCGSQSPT